MTQLYDYEKEIKGAQTDIISLCGELSALKSVLDLQSRYGHVEPDSSRDEFRNMLRMTADLLLKVSKSAVAKTTVLQRARETLQWPFDTANLKKRLFKLEGLRKSFLPAFMVNKKLTPETLGTEIVRLRLYWTT